MQDEHRITELRYVKHPKGSIGGPDPDFPRARADGWHGLPIVWFQTQLHLFELEAGIVAGIFREVPKSSSDVPIQTTFFSSGTT